MPSVLHSVVLLQAMAMLKLREKWSVNFAKKTILTTFGTRTDCWRITIFSHKTKIAREVGCNKGLTDSCSACLTADPGMAAATANLDESQRTTIAAIAPCRACRGQCVVAGASCGARRRRCTLLEACIAQAASTAGADTESCSRINEERVTIFTAPCNAAEPLGHAHAT